MSIVIRLSSGEEIARALRTWRREAGYNQRLMAAMLGVSQSTYSRWERNAIKPPACFIMDGKFAGFSGGDFDRPGDYLDADG